MKTIAAFNHRFVDHLWKWYAAGFIALALTNLITLAIPQLAKIIVNHLADGIDLNSKSSVALTIVGLGCLQVLIRALSRVLIFWPGRQIEMDLKDSLFARILALPQRTLLRYGVGELISRLGNDVGMIRAFYAFGVLQIVNLICLLLLTITKMAQVHVYLTILSLLPLVIAIVVVRIGMPRMHKASRQSQEALGRLTTKVTECFVNVHVIQANSAENAFLDRMEIENQEVFASNMRVLTVRTVIFPLMTCLAGISQLAVLFYGGSQVMSGAISIGDILAFNIYIGLLAFPLSAIGIILGLYQRAQTSLERLSAIDEEKIEHESPKLAVSEIESAPLLRVHHLNFTYPDSATPVLQDVSFEMKAGERFGISGPVGSGKTTLFNLLTRLYDPPPNTIFWRGRDVLTINPAQLRHEIGYALQSAHLFSSTIAANLTFGLSPKPDLSALKAAAQAACVRDDIERFADQWETEIGERGVRLSGGQKQRLSLARLFLRYPHMLLLDDILSAVDQRTEKRLVSYIHSTNVALMIISHRPSALVDCHRILLLEAGRISDSGTYRELAARHGNIFSDHEAAISGGAS